MVPALQIELLDRAFRGAYAGREVIVIGGGPSVGNVDLVPFDCDHVIATNVAIWDERLAPLRERFVAGMALDASLVRRHLRELAALPFPVFTGNTPHDNNAFLDWLNALGIHRVPCNHTEGLGDGFGSFVNGGNSGFAAIQLAIIMGFRQIGLLGFDGPVHGPANYHDLYRATTRPSLLSTWCSTLDRYHGVFKALGVEVLNLSPDSLLQHYTKADPAAWAQYKAAGPPDVDASTPLELPFVPSRARSAVTVDGTNACYGGAVNAADPARAVPLHRDLVPLAGAPNAVYRDDLLGGTHGGASEGVSSNTPAEPPATSRRTSTIREPEMPVRVFIGTEPRMSVAERVLAYSIQRHASVDVEFVFMSPNREPWCGWNIGRRPGVRPSAEELAAHPESIWYTDFTNFRWAIPELCSFEGLAIYMDVDVLVLGDVGELVSLATENGITSVSPTETSVMIVDGRRFADQPDWPSIDQMRVGGVSLHSYTRLAQRIAGHGTLPARWNCIDGAGFSDDTRLIHFSDMTSQPWRPYPEQLQYVRCRVPEAERLWFEYARAAFNAGAFDDTRTPLPRRAGE